MLQRIHFETREDWLNGRMNSIGASEAAAVIGISPFLSNIDLWRKKTGRALGTDLKDNASVDYGVRMEPVLREFFAADHPEMDISYSPFDILYQSEVPWITATLDGEILEKATGRKGVLEIKTVQATSRRVWETWREAIPKYYYAQLCHQLNATGFDFSILFALMKKIDGDAELRAYRFERTECSIDMEYLLRQETSFWKDYVCKNVQPARILPEI